jgi:hypothetical protein
MDINRMSLLGNKQTMYFLKQAALFCRPVQLSNIALMDINRMSLLGNAQLAYGKRVQFGNTALMGPKLAEWIVGIRGYTS